MTLGWADFYATHFADASRRAGFAEQLGMPPSAEGAGRSPPPSLEELEDRWTRLAPGESESDWQARHGVQYLTPGAARVFDASRRFRERRARSEQGEESGNHPTLSSEPGAPASDAGSAMPDAAHAPERCADLEALRTRALGAMRRPTRNPSVSKDPEEGGTLSRDLAAEDVCHPYPRAPERDGA